MSELTLTKQRNFQLDGMKLLLAVVVFFIHTSAFITPETGFDFPVCIGFVSNHFFYVIAGFLMMYSASLKEFDPANAGKQSLEIILRKFKRIASKYWVALAFAIIIYILIFGYTHNGVGLKTCISITLQELPEMFCVQFLGLANEQNPPVWFVSCMLIVMLPLYYLLIKHKDAFVHIIAPLLAFGMWGYMYQLGGYITRNTWYDWCYGGIIRALSGVCFGVVAWLIYNSIKKCEQTTKNRVKFTLAELALAAVIVWVWLFSGYGINEEFCMVLLIPVYVAVVFSGQSYVSLLFKAKWMKIFEPVSLLLFFNHWAAMRIVLTWHPGLSYDRSVAIMALYTLGLCLLNIAIVKIIEKIRKVKG